MARMYDVARRDFRSRPEDDTVTALVTDVVRGPAKVFEITNVWQYVTAKIETDADLSRISIDPERDFPIVTPPFGWSWWEWTNGGLGTAPGTYSPDRTAVAVECIDLWDDETYPQEAGLELDARVEGLLAQMRLAEAVSDAPWEEQERVWNETAFAVLLQRDNIMPRESREIARRFGDRIRWMVSVALCFEETNHVWGPIAAFIFPIAPNGALLPASNDNEVQEILDDVIGSGTRLRGRDAFADSPFVMGGAITVSGRANFEVYSPPRDGEALYAFSGTEPVITVEEITTSLDSGDYKRLLPGDDKYDESFEALTDQHVDAARRAEQACLVLGLYPFLQAVAFTHLRNVEVAPVAPPPKMSARAKRKHGRPLVRYSTIEITPLKVAIAARKQKQRAGLAPGSIGLHIRRGHFAHYGDCCPTHAPKGLLFGKYTGRFWIPAHLRGRAQEGVIVADYEVAKTESEVS